MAASLSGLAAESCIGNHPLFDELQRGGRGHDKYNHVGNIVETSDSDIFVWDQHKSHLLTTNINCILKDEERNPDRDRSFQTLLCIDTPLFTVNQLTSNASSQYICLWGTQGVTVLELPRRWGRYAQYEGGKAKVLCRSIGVGTHMFHVYGKVQILDVKWFPSSVSDTLLLVLTSDNILRLYDIRSPESPVYTLTLSEADISAPRSRTGLLMALGENAVAFDFGPPDGPPIGRHNKHIETDQKWVPIFILFGNGDVYYVLLSENYKPSPSDVKGPLTMHPAAEDNYGTDATSIMCLATTPPLLIIATSGGQIYHTVVLYRTDDLDETSVLSNDLGSSSQWRSGASIEPSLYVFESIELELALTTVSVENDEVVEDDFVCPLKLHKDIHSGFRYHCYHSAGIHSLLLPWIPMLEEFSANDDFDEFLAAEQPSVVEHLLCTKPLPSSPSKPVKGLAVLREAGLDTLLLVLTFDCECLTMKLRNHMKLDPPLLASAMKTSKMGTSPLRGLSKESFLKHIQKITHRSSSNPKLKSGQQDSDLTQQQLFQLLTRATQVFREEYIQKLDLAREEIEKRVAVLQEQKEEQLKDLSRCKQAKDELRTGAERLADKIEIATDNQNSNMTRLECLLRKVQRKMPVLSDSERQMSNELTSMEEHLNIFKNSIAQIQTRNEYQSKQIAATRKRTSVRSPLVSEKQSHQLKEALREENDSIGELVNMISSLKTQVDV